jgi:hypothetical protein
MRNEDIIIGLSETIDEVLSTPVKQKYSVFKDQPVNVSWIHFYWSYGGLAGEYTSNIEYANAKEFQQQLIIAVNKVFTPPNLELLRQAKLTEFGMHIGPYTPSGSNINNENGIEVIPEMKDRISE